MSTKAQIDDEEDDNFNKIKEGFTVNYMQMRDGTEGRVMWEVKSWDLKKPNHTENAHPIFLGKGCRVFR